ncbi:UbiH/UbiF/VisC/COQ6 family ubiquinone biosynthesis hydroxylase [Ningiella sp. W23]|uniref:UbiH/UbiF/VisC/COQ6 family ubiquinone biosynthesis hydroxylase n=1 Tax=Ningiella sp. W23 TaxID=3023715 RepID=UPI003756AD06
MSQKRAQKTPNTSFTQCDIVIVGAGIVGQTLALLLNQAGQAQSKSTKTDEKPPLSIVIVDSQEALDTAEAAESPTFSPRVSAISAASQKVLEQAGVWDAIKRKQAYTQMQVWESDGFGNIDFNAKEIKAASLGYIIENDQIVSGLYSKGLEKGIDYRLGQRIESINMDSTNTQNSPCQLALSNGSQISAKLLVGADGANSFVREKLGFRQTFWDYGHTAIVANLHTELKHADTARQAFMPSGPLAFLPLADAHQCSIVWSQQTDEAKRLLALPDAAFCKEIAIGIDMHLGQCELSSKRFSFGLRMRYCRQWVDESAVLIGDAAHTIHPLAGQGANLGIGDALALAENISASIEQGKSFYAKQQLRKYERYRKAQAQKVIASMEGFKQLFAGDLPAKKFIRNLGLAGANKISAVKQFFIQQAEG